MCGFVLFCFFSLSLPSLQPLDFILGHYRQGSSEAAAKIRGHVKVMYWEGFPGKIGGEVRSRREV